MAIKIIRHQETGQRGGRTLFEEYGPEFYLEIGSKGGRAPREEEEDYGEGYSRDWSGGQQQEARLRGIEFRWREEKDECENEGDFEDNGGFYVLGEKRSREEC